jgi:hypothetical protein
MRTLVFVGAVTIAFGGALVSGPATAMPVDGLATVPLASDVQQVQFLFGGREYCWYDGGWHGPGWYWCGYAFRRGYGWGGGYGWHGWRGGHVGGSVFRHGGRGSVGIRSGGSRTVIRSGGGGGRSAVRAGGRSGGGGGHGRGAGHH